MFTKGVVLKIILVFRVFALIQSDELNSTRLSKLEAVTFSEESSVSGFGKHYFCKMLILLVIVSPLNSYG